MNANYAGGDQALLDDIRAYWTERAPGYAKVNVDELNGCQRKNWSAFLDREIRAHFRDRERASVRVLDMGAGPGFISIILTELGYSVTAADYTEAMLEQARTNAGALADKISFVRTDAQDPCFDDESFDVVFSRNLTWNLEHPEKAYAEWKRLLVPNGLMLVFDANWYAYLFDREAREAYERDRRNTAANGVEDHYNCTDIDAMERIALDMPLSPVRRPEWDVETLTQLGMRDVRTIENVGSELWSDIEKLNYAATPMFMVGAVK